MPNYHEIATRVNDHRSLLLAEAEQRRLILALGPTQPHPIFTWIGQQWIGWGRQLRGEKRMPAFTPSDQHLLV